MPTLLEQCIGVYEGLTRAHLANQTRQELAALQMRTQEWTQRKARRVLLRLRLELLESDQLLLAEARAANVAVVPLAAQARQRLSLDGVQGLAQDGLWMKLLNGADSANEKTAVAIRQAWRALTQQAAEVMAPTALGTLVPRTPANDAALVDYRRAYGVFQGLVRQDMPTDAAMVQALYDAVERLREARGRLTMSAPEEVKRFLDAVDVGGAHLELLTPGVLKWLAEHDDITRFVVKSRASTAWG